MQTDGGVKLNAKEIALVKDLEKVAAKWAKDGKDLWLFSASGSLWVMLEGGTKRNKQPTMNDYNGSVNKENAVYQIHIRNDGGDW